VSDLWRRTKIVATLGPGSDDPDTIEALIQAGVNVFRLNFSHGLAEHHVVTAGHVRAISQRLDQPVAVLCDLQGPKIRIGQFADNQKPQLEVGDRFELSTLIDPLAGSNKGVYLEAWVLTDLAPKDRLLIDDGRLELEVQSLDDQCAVCVVRRGGIISGLKGVNKFGGGLSAPALTEKDFSDLKVAAELKTDYLAVSFVKSAEDVHLARQHLTSAGSQAHIIAKMERAEAIAAPWLSEIIAAADGIMVARGDLGVEIGDENLIAVQKELISRAISANKVTITATQMMESMIDAPTPTRAEVFDVANAVLDGTDAVMLSAETAVGRYPVETVRAMARVIVGAEQHPTLERAQHQSTPLFGEIDQAVALSAMYAANQLSGIKAVICLTETGKTPRWMSRMQSSLPIFALAEQVGTSAITALYKGVIPVYFAASTMKPSMINHLAVEAVRKIAHLEPGDLVIMTKGDFVNVHGGTNTLKIIRIGDMIQ
jgi:pyruvate kinase